MRAALRYTTTPRDAKVEIADDTLIKMMLSEAAIEDEDISAADLPNAYYLAERLRPPLVLRLPDTVDKFDAEGYERGLFMVVPHYGEEKTGDDLDKMVKAELEESGMQRGGRAGAPHHGRRPRGRRAGRHGQSRPHRR